MIGQQVSLDRINSWEFYIELIYQNEDKLKFDWMLREREKEWEREKGNRIYGLKITTTLGKFMRLVRFEILDA